MLHELSDLQRADAHRRSHVVANIPVCYPASGNVVHTGDMYSNVTVTPLLYVCKRPLRER